MSGARDRWIAQWTETDRRERALKNASGILPLLYRAYQALSPTDRVQVDTLLAEWVETAELAHVGEAQWVADATEADIEAQARWHSALALVDEFHITSAIPALRRLADRLEHTPGPLARDVRREILDKVLPNLERTPK